MRTTPFTRIPKITAWAISCLLILPVTSHAKDHKKHKKDQNQSSQNQQNNPWNNNPWNNNNQHNNQGRYQQNNTAQSVAGFVLALANGYAGRGYYYGPPNTSYYNRSPQVVYYATREAAPGAYSGYDSRRVNSMEASIQQALARDGYYRGPIDGNLGPGSRRAIANYHADHGLRVTGYPTNSLLSSMGLQ
jgi:Putative peptidoglycan binding domain